MKTSNILGKNEEFSNRQYCLYNTRLTNSLLISTHLVGKVYYAEEIVEGGICEKGAILLRVEILGMAYDYVTYEAVKILKKYCQNGGIVDYNAPVLLVERIQR
ncbi:cylX protein [Streptococcus lutetiensis]|uniref:cylX protein n=1 Tax=Streptococcus lutetiensis TaxID=150055 RepID=UPI001963CCEB|nr:cylX protein [Streptococcus lutetiensis]